MADIIIGLDIGTSAVRAAAVDAGGGTPALLNYGQVGLPPRAVTEGEVSDWEAVVGAIRRLWDQGGFSQKQVQLGVAGLRAITREIDLPYVADDEIESAVRFQSDEIIPFPAEKTLLDTKVLADFTGPDGNRVRRVLIAAAHRDLVEGVVGAVEAAGLEPMGVDLLSSALIRLMAIGGSLISEPEAIVSIGAGLTVVVVHQGGNPQFVRTIGLGGNSATGAIAGALDIPFNDAENLKLQLAQGGVQADLALRAVESTIDQIVNEVKGSIRFYGSRPGASPVARALLTGGGALLSGLPEALAEKGGVPLYSLPVFQHLELKVDVTPEQMSLLGPVLAAPVGLCLPEPSHGAKRFNLLPPEVTARKKEKRLQSRMIAAAAAIVVILIGLGVLRFFQVHNAENNVASLNSQISSLNAQIPRYDAVVAVDGAYASETHLMGPLTASSVNWLDVMGAIQSHTPPGFTVTGFSGTPATTSTSTAAPSTSAPLGQVSVAVTGPGLASASKWLNTFSALPQFADVTISGVTVSTSGVASFSSQMDVTASARQLYTGGV